MTLSSLLVRAIIAVALSETLLRADTIDLSATHQTIDHFGASDAWSFQAIGAWPEAKKNELADLLYDRDKGIGLSLYRFNLGAGIQRTTIDNYLRTAETFEVAEGKYDWTKQANERWFLRAAKARGVDKFLAFVCSPPARLTRSGFTNSGDGRGGDADGSTNLAAGKEKAFATYLADILAHFAKNPDANEHIEFDWISPYNEPQWDWKASQEGNRASNDDIKRLATALAPALKRENLKTKIHLVESGNIPDMYQHNDGVSRKYNAPFGDYVDFFARDKTLLKNMGNVVGYHSYWSDNLDNGQFTDHRERLRKKLDEYPGVQAWQTEYCVMEWKRDFTIAYGLRVARVVHADLTIVNVTGWSYWLAVSPYDYKDGMTWTDYHKPGDPENILPSKAFWALGNYSKFVRPGMKRVTTDAPQDLRRVVSSAYLDEKTGRVAAVYLNFTDEEQPVTLRVTRKGKDVTPATFTPHVTSEIDDLQAHPAATADQLKLPPRSVVTFVGETK